MARFSCSVVLLLLGFLAGAAAAVPGGGGCEVSALAADVAASCAAGAATPPCCEAVLASVHLGGGACLCHLASEMPVLHAGLSGSALAALYAGCHGGALSSIAAGVVEDRVGGAPELLASASSLGGPVSLNHNVVIRVVKSLAKDDKAVIRAYAATQVIGLFLWLIIGAGEVYSCIYGRKGLAA